MRLSALSGVVGLSLATASLTLAGTTANAATSARPHVVASGTQSTSAVKPLARRVSGRLGDTPPTTADCLASSGIPCYDPTQLRKAYDLDPLSKQGLTGKGSTIVIVDSFGSPTVKADLKKFDADFGLPDPPKFDIIQPAGVVPPFDPTDATQSGWGQETSLDVQWAHSVAPGANLLLVETPVAETEGVTGLPEIVKAENYVVDHRLGDVITQSFGATEDTFPTAQAILNLRSAVKNAAAHGVTVLASSGDAGPTDFKLDGTSLYTHRVDSWPSSDPLVTSVGGTQIHLDADGNRTAPDNVWNDTALFGTAVAGGGTVSNVFARPAFQRSVASVVGAHRGTPDISMNAAVDGGVLVYIGYSGGDGITPGYYIFGGTSASSPEFSGVVAIARQKAHHLLGQINPALYALGSGAPGIPDITRGNNTVTFDQNGKTFTVKGYQAVSGYDLASGLGTVDAARLVTELAR